MATSKISLVRPFYPALDGLRAVAILLVFAVHYSTYAGNFRILQWGWVGVDVFFVLSGFLITGILFDTLHKPAYFRNFYIRRALRIFPLFYGFWLLLLLVSAFMHVGWNRYLLATALYAGNFFRTGGVTGAHPNPFLIPIFSVQHPRFIEIAHFWTLCVEEQFYLVWPLIIWLVRSRRPLLWLCIGLTFLAPFLRWFLYLHLGNTIQSGFLYYSTISRLDTLLVGSAVALWLRGPAPSLPDIRRIYVTLLIVPTSALVLLLRSRLNVWPELSEVNPIINTAGFTLIALACAGILLATIDSASIVSRSLNNRPLVAIGRLSYGIYFIHFLGYDFFVGNSLNLARFHIPFLIPFVAFVCTYAAAWLSFRYFESPFLRLKDRLAPHRGHPSDPPPAKVGPSAFTPPYRAAKPTT